MAFKVISAQNLNLAVDLRLPATTGVFPLVVILPGFTESKDDADLVNISRELVGLGIGAICFDASGSGESEGRSQDLYRVSHYYKDIESVVEYCKKLEVIDKNRIGLFGHSLGGMLAIIYAARNLTSAVCALSPPYNILNAVPIQEEMAEWKHTGKFTYRRNLNQSDHIGYGFVKDAQQWSIIDRDAQVQAPLLFIVGGVDKVVPMTDSQRAYEAILRNKQLQHLDKRLSSFTDPPVLESNGVLSLPPTSFIHIPEMGHYRQFEYIREEVSKFFTCHLLKAS